MEYNTSELCDIYQDMVDVLEPMLCSFGGRASFGGVITTVKCFESNGLIREVVKENGVGRVLLIDGGGSMRRAMVGGNLAVNGAKNGWAGILVHGCVRDVDELGAAQIGIRALGTHPMRTAKLGTGEVDVAVQIGGIWVRPGDWVYADDDGVVISDRALTA